MRGQGHLLMLVHLKKVWERRKPISLVIVRVHAGCLQSFTLELSIKTTKEGNALT